MHNCKSFPSPEIILLSFVGFSVLINKDKQMDSLHKNVLNGIINPYSFPKQCIAIILLIHDKSPYSIKNIK